MTVDVLVRSAQWGYWNAGKDLWQETRTMLQDELPRLYDVANWELLLGLER